MLTIFTIAILLFASYFILRIYAKPIIILFSPLVITLACWLFVGGLYFLAGQTLRLRTEEFVFGSAICWFLGGVFAFFCQPKYLKRFETDLQLTFSSFFSMILLALQFFALVSAGLLILKSADYGGISVSTIVSGENDSRSILRGILATKDYNSSLAIKLINQLRIFNIINPPLFYLMFHRNKCSLLLLLASIFLAILYSFLFFDRSGIMRICISLLICHFIFLNSTLWKKIKIGFYFFALFCFFMFLIPLVRQQLGSFSISPSRYFGGALFGLDAFISGYSGQVDLFEQQVSYISKTGFEFGDAPIGLENFNELYKFINIFSETQFSTPKNKEYIYLADTYLTNIYTALRGVYQDFGFMGGLLFVFFGSFFINLFYIYSLKLNVFLSTYVVGLLAFISFSSVIANNFVLREFFIAVFLCFLLRWILKSRCRVRI